MMMMGLLIVDNEKIEAQSTITLVHNKWILNK